MKQNDLKGISPENLPLIEEQYEKYLHDPRSVLPVWADFFDGQVAAPVSQVSSSSAVADDFHIFELIRAYRTYGHLFSRLNPINTHPLEEPAELRLETVGLRPEDLNRSFPTGGILPQPRALLKDIIATLREIYCGKIGFEYMGAESAELERWIQARIEPTRSRVDLSIEQKKQILQQLNRSERFELFLHKNYTGQKRFSLEGGETLIPILNTVVESSADLGYDEFVLGMAHRGRLNVLCNVMDKSYGEIFSEFEDGHLPDSFEGSGDVKYHKGFMSDIQTSHGRKVRISLTPNPSHLESVYPVVEGQVRAKQVKQADNKNRVMPVIIHGDASIAGQGVVYETLQMYNLAGYGNGGTVHIVVNNQIGFTTLPKDGRSTYYCTDIARAFTAPVFHVNAEDPEACVYATNLALAIRHHFHIDVFIDLNCYRKFGHNETDEPAFTQPLEYQLIRQKKPIREIYRDQLIQQGVLEREVAEALEEEFDKSLHLAKPSANTAKAPVKPSEAKPTVDPLAPVDTKVPLKTLVTITERFCTVPEGFNIHPKLQHLLTARVAMAHGEHMVDWGMAEHLALGSILWEGVHVRLTGQDTRRGTFSHRHAMWMDQALERKYFSLSKLKPEQGRFDVFNSLLSEYAALAFEFGYSVTVPDALVVWEAQFGDFANGAQVVIDQYISTAEQKWGLRFGLVLLLPHGHEGQGPEHTSARMERFLTLCGHDNMWVVNPTTPAQLYHMLRRQVKHPVRKPLIVFTPKGLLRHPACVSTIEELAEGAFQTILDDPQAPSKPKRLAFCCGRIYYDLIAEREKRKVDDLRFIRVEQLYPFDQKRVKEILAGYRGIKEFVWVQEEPSNMGAWTFIRPHLHEAIGLDKKLEYIGRERSASPATGSFSRHMREHNALMDALFRGGNRE